MAEVADGSLSVEVKFSEDEFGGFVNIPL